jgi:formylglycine-generating enzyme required for sulfatase activity
MQYLRTISLGDRLRSGMSETGVANLSTFEFTMVTVNAQGQEITRNQNSASSYIEALGETASLQMVAIPGGEFLMGALPSEEGWSPAQAPQHLVTVQPFFMGRYVVTQAQWQAVAALPKVNHFLNPEPTSTKESDRPIEQVSWQDAVEFCARLSQHTGREYRLPSEAEWEYACRAGTATPFHFGATITTELANYSGIDWDYMGKICSRGAYGAGPQGSDRRETTPVGYFQVANSFGLSDMHGNVREWCLDLWHDTYQGAPTDGSVWLSDAPNSKRVLRGGSWNGGPRACRSASRTAFDPDRSLYDIGFRVVSRGSG